MKTEKNADNVQVENLFHKLDLDSISVNQIIRLGKRPEGEEKPRPVKVVIASEEQKESVLHKAKNLGRWKDGALKGIFLHQDLTPKQRKRRQELVQELRQRQSMGDNNLIIVNWKIVKRRSNGHQSEQVDPQ